MSSKSAAQAAQSASRVIPVHKKYTVQSTGIWERIRRTLSIDPSRSNGIPLNPQFRNPPPGANPAEEYDDSTTVPAADIAENPYWKRDVRRSYPRLSVVGQADVVGLLSVGSKAAPTKELVGEAGSKELVKVREEGEEKGLAALFERDGKSVRGVLGKDGLPPLPGSLSPRPEGKNYVIDTENGYPEKYPCRTFV